MLEAFEIFSNKMGIISFYQGADRNADILVGCSNDYIEVGENLFAAGEGGPSRIINSSWFKVIEKGKISLYNDPQCDYPIVEVHELLHVFGFDHVSNPKSAMYNTSSCDQRITPDMISIINKLYSIEPLPDATVGKLCVIKRGKYLDFNITVLNNGLIDIENIFLDIVAEGKKVKQIDLDDIKIGSGRTLVVTNLKLPSVNIEVIDFVLDRDDIVAELDENNNLVQMTLQSS